MSDELAMCSVYTVRDGKALGGSSAALLLPDYTRPCRVSRAKGFYLFDSRDEREICQTTTSKERRERRLKNLQRFCDGKAGREARSPSAGKPERHKPLGTELCGNLLNRDSFVKEQIISNRSLTVLSVYLATTIIGR